MNITGIIAEYNPFHKGHQFHIEEARRLSNADAVIVVMSGSFVQRGTCAIADKYTRAESALMCGADLVMELPTLYAVSSAEFFAGGGVSVLAATGIVTHLAFGCETGTLSDFEKVSVLLAEEPPAYRQALKGYIAGGHSFPKARELAVMEMMGNPSAKSLLSQPNNILGVEYCKRLHIMQSPIRPVLIPRVGGGYHQSEADAIYSSATSIREQLLQGCGIHKLSSQLPDCSYDILSKNYNCSFPMHDEDLSSYVHHALLRVPHQDFTPYLDITEELSNRISRHLYEYASLHPFVTLLKTKDITYSRICRCLMHILLDMRKSDCEPLLQDYAIPYLRVLGMGARGDALLRAIREHTHIPLIMNPSKHMHSLSAGGQYMLGLDCLATHLWNGAAMDKFKVQIPNEYNRRFLKINS